MDPAAQHSAKSDFPDWLSPMLVKELRQGMRSRIFVWSFLAVQAGLVFLALLGLMNAVTRNSSEEVTFFFWLVVCVPLLLVMPFSGLGAISREKEAQTLDLIFLTRLTARRIVFGKWVAIISQAFLLASAVLPYTVLRYYFGSVDLKLELETLGWLFLSSLVIAGVMVGVSASVGRVGRVLLTVAAVIGLFVSSMALDVDINSQRGGPLHDWQFYTTMIVEGLLATLLMLEFGAGKIAPAAENHSTGKRLLALASVFLMIAYSWSTRPAGYMVAWAIFIGLVAAVDSLFEPVRELASAYRPFVRWGLIGRAFGWLFYPGWASGMLFTLVLIGIAEWRLNPLFTVMWHVHDANGRLILHIWDVALIGTFFVPLALAGMARVRFRVIFFVVLQVVFFLLSLMGQISTENHWMGNPGAAGIEEVVSIIPSAALMLSYRFGKWEPEQLNRELIAVSIVTGIAFAYLLIRSIPAWRTIYAMERAAAKLPASPTPRTGQ